LAQSLWFALSLPAAERGRMDPLSSFALRAANAWSRPDDRTIEAVPMVSGVVMVMAQCSSAAHRIARPSASLADLFHNSVHNASAGYWSIGLGGPAPTTALAVTNTVKWH
jgi:hypothetical protein